MADTTKEQRRICWPNPDGVCLEGGCGYCNYERFRDVKSIRKYVDKHPELEKDFIYGMQRGWNNAKSRFVADRKQ